MTETVLQEAERLINGDRQEQYGDASESFDRIADLWAAYLGTTEPLTGLDVANLMILLKVSRTKGTFLRDSYVDIGGYAGLGERLHQEANSEVIDVEVVESRSWPTLGKVPFNVKVVDSEGDPYVAKNMVWYWGTDQTDLTSEEIRTWDYGPFTEVFS